MGDPKKQQIEQQLTNYANMVFRELRRPDDTNRDMMQMVAHSIAKYANVKKISLDDVLSWLQGAYGAVFIRNTTLTYQNDPTGMDMKEVQKIIRKVMGGKPEQTADVLPTVSQVNAFLGSPYAKGYIPQALPDEITNPELISYDDLMKVLADEGLPPIATMQSQQVNKMPDINQQEIDSGGRTDYYDWEGNLSVVIYPKVGPMMTTEEFNKAFRINLRGKEAQIKRIVVVYNFVDGNLDFVPATFENLKNKEKFPLWRYPMAYYVKTPLSKLTPRETNAIVEDFLKPNAFEDISEFLPKDMKLKTVKDLWIKALNAGSYQKAHDSMFGSAWDYIENSIRGFADSMSIDLPSVAYNVIAGVYARTAKGVLKFIIPRPGYKA